MGKESKVDFKKRLVDSVSAAVNAQLESWGVESDSHLWQHLQRNVVAPIFELYDLYQAHQNPIQDFASKLNKMLRQPADEQIGFFYQALAAQLSDKFDMNGESEKEHELDFSLKNNSVRLSYLLDYALRHTGIVTALNVAEQELLKEKPIQRQVRTL